MIEGTLKVSGFCVTPPKVKVSVIEVGWLLVLMGTWVVITGAAAAGELYTSDRFRLQPQSVVRGTSTVKAPVCGLTLSPGVRVTSCPAVSTGSGLLVLG